MTPSPELYTVASHLHGHAAVLAVALLLHPVVWLRPGRAITPRVRWTARLGTGLLVGVYTLGLGIYPTYRARVKPGLIFENGLPGPLLELALRFESKEHLAVLAVALAVAGLAVLESGPGPATRRAARTLLLGAVALSLSVGALGLWVAAGAHPGW